MSQRHLGAKRVLAWMVSILCLIAAIAVGSGAAWFAQAFGSQGMVISDLGAIPVEPGSQAIVMDVERVDATIPYLPIEGVAYLTIKPATAPTGADPADIFVGLGQAEAIDAYLDGSTYAVARFEGDGWSMTPVPGRRPLGSTADVPWTASARGPAPSIRLSGHAPTSVAIMNGNLSQPVSVRAYLVLSILQAGSYQSWAVGIAVLLLVLAITFGYVASVRLSPAHAGSRPTGPAH